MKLSIVIVCMNRLDNLYPCLESIRRHCKLEYEVLVVAYKFTAVNLAKVCADFPWVKFIESQQTRGFSENNNLALRRARGEFCFVLNDDTEMHSDVISRLLDDFAQLPDNTAIVCPRLVNADGSLQLCGRPHYPTINYALQQWHLYREPIDDTVGKRALFDEVFPTSNISGAAFLIRTDIFRSFGWFDERYVFTPEDIALSTLARANGYGVYVDRAVTVTHKWRTTASAISIAVRPASIRGSLIFFSQGNSLRYLALAFAVWTAEFAKYVKACLLYLLAPSDARRIKMLTFRANTRAIFTHKSPKQLFQDNSRLSV